MKRKIIARIFTALFIIILILYFALCIAGCDVQQEYGTKADISRTQDAANTLQDAQRTPTDISYSLERYNLIRRAYWVNGQREKANALPCPVEKPLGYIVLISGNVVIGNFVVDGKVSSLNSFLTPDSEYYEVTTSSGHYYNKWLSDVDGSYGENDQGIFFFTPDGKYIEWKGNYLYSDIPFVVESPILSVAGGN